LVDHRSIVLNLVTGSLAHLQIARAYSITGDTTRAKAAYEDFLALWKDADSNVPILQKARREYAKLR
jgi:eukaryotic-like serine/threonine-protein kinase